MQDDADFPTGPDGEKPQDEQPRPDSDSGGIFSTLKENKLYVGVALIAVVFVSALYMSSAFTGMTVSQDDLSADEAGEAAVEFINDYLLTDEEMVSYESTTEESGLYKIAATYNGQEIFIHITKDGKYVILPQGLIDVEEYKAAVEAAESQPAVTTGDEIPKSDKPVVNMFVMSYCPYGLQMQKAFIPVMELLGDKADINVNFVHYLMHGEKEMNENNRQYCIQAEQPEVFVDYLKCFVQSDDTEKCQTEAGIDKEELEACIAAADEEFGITDAFQNSDGSYPPYPVDAVLAQVYGVQGSPTVVINGKVASVTRSPEAVKQAICSAFTEPPEECDTKLSSNAAAPSFGALEASGSDTGATC
jgi:protein-disulfide isomerase